MYFLLIFYHFMLSSNVNCLAICWCMMLLFCPKLYFSPKFNFRTIFSCKKFCSKIFCFALQFFTSQNNFLFIFFQWGVVKDHTFTFFWDHSLNKKNYLHIFSSKYDFIVIYAILLQFWFCHNLCVFCA